MVKGCRKGRGFIWPILLLLSLQSSPAQGESLRCSPSLIQIGTFFRGERVQFYGEGPAGSRVVAEIIGEEENMVFMKKGRRGPVWMNIEEVRFERIPNTYFLLWSSKSSTTPSKNKMAFIDGWGYNYLKTKVKIEGPELDEEEKSRLFDEFVKLKESERLYGLLPDGVHVESGNDSIAFKGSFWLPPKIASGDYEVRVYMIKGERVAKTATTEFKVIKVGFPAFLSLLAFQYGEYYGILAVIVAIAVGFLMGLAFRRR